MAKYDDTEARRILGFFAAQQAKGKAQLPIWHYLLTQAMDVLKATKIWEEVELKTTSAGEPESCVLRGGPIQHGEVWISITRDEETKPRLVVRRTFPPTTGFEQPKPEESPVVGLVCDLLAEEILCDNGTPLAAIAEAVKLASAKKIPTGPNYGYPA